MRAATVAEGRIEIADRPVPEPGDGELLVRVHGAGLNRADLLQRAGGYPAPPGVPPDIPGLEFAGIIERHGSEVTGFAPGDVVFGLVGGGAQAEYVTVPAAHCATVPHGIDVVEMGAVPEAFVTVHDAMVTQAHVGPGESLLVHAVGSGVGTAALKLAKALGAMVVGTARSAEKLERCRALGLDHGIVPPTSDDGSLDVDAFVHGIVAATGRGMDVILDLVGGRYIEVDVAVAALRGRIVLIGAMAGGEARLPTVTMMAKRLTMFGTMLRSRDIDEKAAAVAAFERDVVPLLADGTVRPVIDAVLPLDRAAEAYDRLASDTTFGKLVLDCR
jgi:putative PIG3 family NAD(P)H quinone oxidoreductase